MFLHSVASFSTHSIRFVFFRAIPACPAGRRGNRMRYFFEITYKGTVFHGWQSQYNATGIQQVVEEALSRLLREEISITGSGRTDTGVHCTQQFFHADIDKSFDPGNLVI